jgi:hypothetical protein
LVERIQGMVSVPEIVQSFNTCVLHLTAVERVTHLVVVLDTAMIPFSANYMGYLRNLIAVEQLGTIVLFGSTRFRTVDAFIQMYARVHPRVQLLESVEDVLGFLAVDPHLDLSLIRAALVGEPTS